MRVGDGKFQYELIHDWGRLPAQWSFGAVSDGAVDSQGRVYLLSRSAHPVMSFDPDGLFLGAWGEGMITKGHGITIGPDDSVYVVDEGDHTVKKFTSAGKLLFTLGTQGRPSDTGYNGKDYRTIKRPGPPFNRPTSLAVAPSGELYVTDGYGNVRVHKFSADGHLLSSWGEIGTGPGQFRIVHTVCVDKRGTLYVADRESDRVQVFDAEGKFLAAWTDMHRPNGMFLGADDCLYLTELYDSPRAERAALPAQISIWTLQGEQLARWGAEDFSVPANFFAPHGLWGDAQGNLYVGELEVSSHRGPRPAAYPAVHKLVRVS
ncbi:MAG TPA: peptidyl-alpha-hydroxyglycine alpha-amidating lyase family protein [bacterium]|nr:peptidyl-alpha-hydroxyglycine alpha-amidating lyase family protein [bacterium]